MSHFSPAMEHSQRGIGLIEVLVSLFLFSLGLLGVAGMQTVGLKNNQSSFERSQVVIESYSIVDAIRANLDGLQNGEYELALPATGCTIPTPSSLASSHLANWLTSLQTNLGDTACGGITCDAGVCSVSVRWDDSRGTQGSVQQVIETKVRP